MNNPNQSEISTMTFDVEVGCDRRRGISLAGYKKSQIQELIAEGRPLYLRANRIKGEKRVCFYPLTFVAHDVGRWYKLKLRGMDGSRLTTSAPAHLIFHTLPVGVPLVDAKYRRQHKKKARQDYFKNILSKMDLVIERMKSTGNKFNEWQFDDIRTQVVDISHELVVQPEMTLDVLSKEYPWLRRDMNSEFTPAW